MFNDFMADVEANTKLNLLIELRKKAHHFNCFYIIILFESM